MKAIMYMSQSVDPVPKIWLPANLENILARARSNNRKHGISGVLSFKKGHYLQIVEGPNDEVDQLYANIQHDPRHKSVSVICTIQTKQRYLQDWDMKLIPFCAVDTQFVKFMKDHVVGKNDLSTAQQEVFSLFYNLQSTQHDRPSMLAHNEHEYRLKCWPNFLDIKPTPALLGLCALLIGGGWLSCEQLLADSDYGRDKNLHRVLDDLNAQKLLEHRNLQTAEATARRQVVRHAQTPSDSNDPGGLSFYQRMKQFLGARRVS